MHVYRYYPSISIFSPDLSSTVKWSSQTVICLSQRFNKDSSNSERVGTLLLNKILQIVDSCNLCISGGNFNGALLALFTELENLLGNLIVMIQILVELFMTITVI